MNLIFQITGNHVGQVHVHHAETDSKSQKVMCQVDSTVILVNSPAVVKTEREMRGGREGERKHTVHAVRL